MDHQLVGQGIAASGGAAIARALFYVAPPPDLRWRLWVFTGVWVGGSTVIFLYLLAHPALFLRRLRAGPIAEREASQKIIISLTLALITALAIVIALDMRNGWSDVPTAIALVGDALFGAGLLLVLLVFSVNQFAAASVQVEAGQTVISRGPYAFVRHPMYSGGLLLFLGIPLALGSWWGLALYPAFVVLIVWRLMDEERYLLSHLPGYEEYRRRVRYRLIPSVW
jgi:protein-S-isoprenylcysteine O-methyltransferase Ste14